MKEEKDIGICSINEENMDRNKKEEENERKTMLEKDLKI